MSCHTGARIREQQCLYDFPEGFKALLFALHLATTWFWGDLTVTKTNSHTSFYSLWTWEKHFSQSDQFW